MADASEDNLLQTSVTTATEAPDLDDEVQDFRFLLSTAQNQKLPSRGIKDFEPHGTNLQQATLASSREAMHMALSQTRIHNRDPQRAVYDENDNGAWVFNPGGSWPSTVGRIKKFPVVQELEPTSRNECEEAADGYESDGSESVVVTTEPEHILPASRPAKKNKQAQPQRLWLLPEEALWLIERGSLEIRWPPDEGQAEDGGIPMSLQGAYSAFIGMEKQNGLTLEQYSVYQYLKRAGYTVLRAKDNIHNVPQHNDSASTIKQTGQLPIFSQLWRRLLVKEPPDVNTRGKIGPLVTPGLYRSYGNINATSPVCLFLF
jgi:tRNA-splicing endonuclease subunit Sen54